MDRFFRSLVIISFIVATVPCFAQNDTVPKAGVYGQVLLNRHTADFRALPGVPSCCPLFESGSGTGFGGGLMYEFPLSSQLGLQFRLGYATHSALLSRTENTTVSVNNVATPGAFEHTIQATLASVGIEPVLRVGLWNGLSLTGGARVGYMMTRQYSQKEEVVQPSDRGVFVVEQLRVRNANSGDIQQAQSLIASLNIGLMYALPLNARGSLHLIPEVSYSYALTSVVEGYTWHPHALRIGAMLQFSFLPQEKTDTPVAVVPKPLPPTPPPDTLDAQLDVTEILPDGTERPLKEIVVEQFRSRHLRPLLNYVFFDENSAVIPERYAHRTSPDGFSMDALVNAGTMETYHQLLDIIGWRLTKKPDAIVTLTGCNANVRGEANNTGLSKQRAEVVAQYLKDVWKIAPNRIKVATRNLPQIPSGSRTEDGIAENRRVEITSNIEEIVEPVITEDTLYISTASLLRFHPRIKATAGFEKWELTGYAIGRGPATSSGIGVGDPTPPLSKRGTTPPGSYDFDLAKYPSSVFTSLERIEARFAVRDNRGKEAQKALDIPIRILTIQQKQRTRTEDISKDKYSMILFDYGQSGISAANRKIMDDVKSRITERSKVEVVGHTDRIGSDESNLKLSTKRANETGVYIGAPNTRSYGMGRKDLLYDNEFPEGRFYCRTVEINVDRVIK